MILNDNFSVDSYEFIKIDKNNLENLDVDYMNII